MFWVITLETNMYQIQINIKLINNNIINNSNNFKNKQKKNYQMRSVGAGGMLSIKIPCKVFNSTVSVRGMLDKSPTYLLTNLLWATVWKCLWDIHFSILLIIFFCFADLIYKNEKCSKVICFKQLKKVRKFYKINNK